jgi:hypothetical protein
MSSDNAGAIDPKTGHAGMCCTLLVSPPLTFIGNAHTGEDFERAPEHAHDRVDAKDQRSHANTVKDALRVEKLEEKADAAKEHVDPTALARSVSFLPCSAIA